MPPSDRDGGLSGEGAVGVGLWNWLLSPIGATAAHPQMARSLTALQVVSDLTLCLACLSLFAALMWLTRIRRELIARPVVLLIALATLATALSQAMAATTPGAPPTTLESLARLIAMGLDVAAVIAFWPMVPRLGAILSDRDEALRSLAASEAEYRTSFESAAVGKVLADPVSAAIQRVNKAFAQMLGYEPEDLVGTNAWDLSFPEDDEGARKAWGRLMSGEDQVYVREKPYRRRDGSAVWARISASVVRDDQGVPVRTYAVIENIDERRHAELAAREYEARLRLAVESAQIAVWELDFAKGMGRLDERASAMTWGQVPAEVWLPLDGPEFAGWVARIHPDDRPLRDAAVKAVRDGAKDVVQMEYRVRRPDGAWGWQSHWRAIVERDPQTDAPTRVLGVIMDTTQRALAEVELRATLAQRDLLLREVYHRVKNNLQIVDGLVMMQARQLKDSEAGAALAGLRSRVYALGLVHHQLMASTNLETFDLGPFLQELVRNILDGGDHDAVALELDVQPLQVDFDFAIPLGLLVTELVTNALKHSLREGRGRIKVACRPSTDGRVLLSVADDGPGRTSDGEGAGLGSIIIAGLVGQLDGEMTTRNAPGLVTEITLRTPERT